MIICLTCGNTEKFERVITYSEIVEETAIIDGETEDEVNYRDNETIDSERSDEGDLCCQECESSDCEFSLNKKEIDIIKWKHTDEKGRWHNQELPENKRDKNIEQEIVLEAL